MNLVRIFISSNVIIGCTLFLFLCGCWQSNPLIVESVLPPSQQIEDSTLILAEPFWSADGKKIIGIMSNYETYGDDFFEVDSGGGRARLLQSDSLAKGRPVLSPDGRMIAYLSAPKGKLYCCAHVFLMNIDGTNTHDVTPFGGNWERIQWSPDSRRIIFEGSVEEDGLIRDQIVNVDVETGVATLLTHGPFNHTDPHFTADGSKILVLSDRIMTDYGGKIFVMNEDGTDISPIDTSKKSSAFPRPSPTRNEFTFAWGFGGEEDDGQFLLNLDKFSTPTAPANFDSIRLRHSINVLQWSPDGNLILFPSGVSLREKALYIMNRDGSDWRRMTTGLDVADFDWSPDSKECVFYAKNLETKIVHIFILNIEQHSIRELKIMKP